MKNNPTITLVRYAAMLSTLLSLNKEVDIHLDLNDFVDKNLVYAY
jgi:hypothetical protein